MDIITTSDRLVKLQPCFIDDTDRRHMDLLRRSLEIDIATFIGDEFQTSVESIALDYAAVVKAL